MTSGGRRNRSGPAADPGSYRSEAKGLNFSRLPADGYRGDIPEHPVSGTSGRTLAVWEMLWRTPQAAAWAAQYWRLNHVADLCRLMVQVEDPDAPMAAYTHLRQARADLGMTPAGLVENGWAIAESDGPGLGATAPASTAAAARKTSNGSWLTGVAVEKP